MKDYRINKKGDYIKTISQKTLSDGTEVLDVKFADGRVFKSVLCNKENMQKIVNQQERQAEEGINQLPRLKKRLTCQGIVTSCTGALSTLAGYEVIQALQSDEPILIPLSIGLLTVTSFMLGLIPFIKNKLVIKEIEKIKYREEHRHDLRAYVYYPNSLVGVKETATDILNDAREQNLDPFYTINIDCFSKKDMKKIVENVKTERKYQFTYGPKAYEYSKKH